MFTIDLNTPFFATEKLKISSARFSIVSPSSLGNESLKRGNIEFEMMFWFSTQTHHIELAPERVPTKQ